jgi:hypothetical protein
MKAEWINKELRTLSLGDARLNNRLKYIISSFSKSPTDSIPSSFDSWKETKGAYRFLSNESIKPADILKPHIESTKKRISGFDRVIQAQDTTEIEFTAHPSKEDAGHLRLGYQTGYLMHTGMAISEQGVPLGLISQSVWSRDPKDIGKKYRRKKLPIEQKESNKWLIALNESEDILTEIKEVITVADREADIFDLFAKDRKSNHHLLIRCAHNRRTSNEGKLLWDMAKSGLLLGKYKIEISRPNKNPRIAILTVRTEQVELIAPKTYKGKTKKIKLYAILATEGNPEGVEWLLLSTLPVNSYAEAKDFIRYYSYRWLIERYHFVLKSGCGVEELQLHTRMRLARALAIYSIVAWRLLWITYQARENPDMPCDDIFNESEWTFIHHKIHENDRYPPPLSVPTIKEAMIILAKMGGFLARKNDGNPGVKALWTGLQKFNVIIDSIAFMKKISSYQLMGKA